MDNSFACFFLGAKCIPSTENSIALLFQISGPILDESQVRGIVDETKQAVIASSSRRREREERARAEDFDAEESELLKEENEQEEEVFDQVHLYCLRWYDINSDRRYHDIMVLFSLSCYEDW